MPILAAKPIERDLPASVLKPRMRGRIKGKGRATVDRAKTGRGKSVGKDGLAGQPLQRDLRVLIDFQVFVETGEGASIFTRRVNTTPSLMLSTSADLALCGASKTTCNGA